MPVSLKTGQPVVTGGRKRSCSDFFYVSRESVCGTPAIHGNRTYFTPVAGCRTHPASIKGGLDA